jgi:hypothetical protein
VENLTFWHKLVSHSLVVLAVQHGASGGTGETEIMGMGHGATFRHSEAKRCLLRF